MYFTIPFIEQTALKADQRIMVTGFGAEETLTSDLVPIKMCIRDSFTRWAEVTHSTTMSAVMSAASPREKAKLPEKALAGRGR